MTSPAPFRASFRLKRCLIEILDWEVLAGERAKSPPHVLGQLRDKGTEHAYKAEHTGKNIIARPVTQRPLELS